LKAVGIADNEVKGGDISGSLFVLDFLFLNAKDKI
jgi:hypothetical protein